MICFLGRIFFFLVCDIGKPLKCLFLSVSFIISQVVSLFSKLLNKLISLCHACFLNPITRTATHSASVRG